MRLKKEVSHFASSCEQLIAEAEACSRTLTDEEALLIEFYCREVLKKVVKRPPSQQEGSSGTSQNDPKIPPTPSQEANNRLKAAAIN